VLTPLAAARARLCENCGNAELPKCHYSASYEIGHGDDGQSVPAVPQCMTSRIREPSVFDANLT
jgi:hypothetical protein